MSEKKKHKVITEIQPELELTERRNAIPMMGWHAPTGDVEYQGETWTVCIAGGCQGIWIRKKDEEHYYSVDIGQIIPVMIEAAKKACA